MRLLPSVYVSQDCSNACALVSFELYWGFYGLDMDGWYFLGLNDHFRILYGFVNLSGLVKYLLIECYLAAKIGTIIWIWFGGSSVLR